MKYDKRQSLLGKPHASLLENVTITISVVVHVMVLLGYGTNFGFIVNVFFF